MSFCNLWQDEGDEERAIETAKCNCKTMLIPLLLTENSIEKLPIITAKHLPGENAMGLADTD